MLDTYYNIKSYIIDIIIKLDKCRNFNNGAII